MYYSAIFPQDFEHFSHCKMKWNEKEIINRSSVMRSDKAMENKTITNMKFVRWWRLKSWFWARLANGLIDLCWPMLIADFSPRCYLPLPVVHPQPQPEWVKLDSPSNARFFFFIFFRINRAKTTGKCKQAYDDLDFHSWESN